jgi:predicted MPP superfamily phosphohydrolase
MLSRIHGIWSSLFFQHFFRLLLFTISVAQWVCIAWGLSLVTDATLPLWAHAAASSSIYAFNRWLVARPGPRPVRSPGVAYRAYSASAFVSVFCFLFLVILAAIWTAAAGVGSQLQAMTTVASVSADPVLGGAFRWVATGGMGAIALLFTYGYVFGQRQLAVTEIDVPVRADASIDESVRIVHLSDIHIGHNMSAAELRAYVARVNAIEADLICITGDIIDAPHVDYARYLPILAELRARAGVVAILGNHDHRAGADEVVAALRRWTSFRVLRDQGETLQVGATRLHVIGLDDRGRDWARGMASDDRLSSLIQAAPGDVPVVLLVHRPDVFPHAAASGVLLTLSGHTHGGQLALPWRRGRRINLADFITEYPRGFYEHDGCFLYVSCGLGVTGQRIRLFTPREIGVVRLGRNDIAA